MIAGTTVLSALLLYNTFPSILETAQNGSALTSWIIPIRDVIFNVMALETFFWIYFAVVAFSTFMFIALSWNYRSKFTNSFIWVLTLTNALVLLLGPIFVFTNLFLNNGSISVGADMVAGWRPISLGVILLLYFFLKMLGGKLLLWIGQKVQAYETAVELRQTQRSNVIWINILKFFQMVFPEVLVCLLVTFMLWGSEMSMFLNFFLGAAILILICNIWRGINIQREAKRIFKRDQNNQAILVRKTLIGGK